MRIFKGLENIHSIIDRHEAEWRKEQGEEPKRPDALSIEETVRRRLTAQPDSGSGRFSADRFLSGSPEPLKHEQPRKPEPEEPEAVEIIKSKDGRHSWLYNEVMKAINDASKNSKNTKIIAVFIPVIQNGKEFESLPADESITLQPISEEAVRVEAVTEEITAPEITEVSPEAVMPETFDAEPSEAEQSEPEEPQQIETALPETTDDDFNLIPEPQHEPDEELAEAFREMEEKLDENIKAENEALNEQDSDNPPEPETAEEALPPDAEEEIILEVPQPTVTLEKIEQPESAEALPFSEAEEKAEVPETEEAQEVLTAVEDDEVPVPDEAVTDITDEQDEQEDISAGEPMMFENIGGTGTEEISLPDELEDDEVADEETFDESLTEVQRADDDDDEETFIVEGNGDIWEADKDENEKEIEILPDPKN